MPDPSGAPVRIEPLLFIALLVLLALGTLAVLAPFLSAIVWAGILCFATGPWFERLTQALRGRRSLAATLMCLLVTALLVAPFLVVGASLADNVQSLSTRLQELARELPPTPPRWLAELPLVGAAAAELWQSGVADPRTLASRVQGVLPEVSKWILSQGLALGHGVVMLGLAVLVAFFIYRDGMNLSQCLARAVERIYGSRGLTMLVLSGATIKGVVYGILGTALAQGILAAIGFFIAGIPGAAVLGLATFFLSIVPMGPPLIWIPAAVWLFFQGQTGMGIFLALWGLLVVSSVDNFLKPYLISQGANMPFILVLFGVLGGLGAFGFLGVFIGPTLLAVAYSLLREWTLAPE
jgi:predicted PurR-regulated permease PerM